MIRHRNYSFICCDKTIIFLSQRVLFKKAAHELVIYKYFLQPLLGILSSYIYHLRLIKGIQYPIEYDKTFTVRTLSSKPLLTQVIPIESGWIWTRSFGNATF